MSDSASRRSLLSKSVSCLVGASATAAAFAQNQVKTLKRSFFQRLTGSCATEEPKDSGCWSHSSGQAVIDLTRAPELAAAAGAIRLEGKGLAKRVLVVRCDDGQYRAFSNHCTHFGRRLDPVPGAGSVQCCSVNASTFDYQGRVVAGPAKSPVQPFAVKVEGGKLFVTVA
jgi:nitrite reductase/ring-hydroxylating ferredoxin subunit